MHLPTICLVILCSLASGQVLFQAKVTCNIGTYWCGELYILEEDWLFHDQLAHDKFCTSDMYKQLDYTVNPKDFPTMDYEIFYKFNHNCTADGKTYCVQPKESKKVHKWVGHRRVKFLIDASANGKPKTCEWPFFYGGFWG
ncbi:DUF870 domain-containing protein [Caenorhabditis elegans]|uniref:Uncharacterized protein n=1 Tax=Caenorhabditis elegans TaxID=6239 RepID=Q20095_CAEEL|nr:Uncharacterized protein CELE_F36A4.2 [Caenorhabditis elegans]CCD69523.1 Uncharacterized protein CELE_F36A4.2 [Caenorhabditis elegans]|eukprot:NP_500528.1 Uncharacterized protein CELE_F36A4.2 [Caenorhabditis elegans]